ncbi:MAG: hypothetical protein R2806_12040 [Saprospiraceae bacterium]
MRACFRTTVPLSPASAMASASASTDPAARLLYYLSEFEHVFVIQKRFNAVNSSGEMLPASLLRKLQDLIGRT